MEGHLSKTKDIFLSQFIECKTILDEDCDLYDSETNELIFIFRKDIIPKNLYNIDEKLIKHTRDLTSNRGHAAGTVNASGLVKGKEHWNSKPDAPCDKDGNPLPDGHQKHTSYFKYADGRVSKRMRSNSVASHSIGGFTKNAGLPCRLTYWTKNNLKSYESIFPLTTYISDRYFEYVPDKWLNQKEKYDNSPSDFVIPGSNFSTLTVNMDFRTASHKDKGDHKGGLTCFTIKECGEWTGGELCFPEYDVGLNVREGDLLLFNPHVTHCNNPLKGEGRMSFVFYLRDAMNKCS
jgi:hypothetical protein